MEFVFICSMFLIIWGLFHIHHQITNQTEAITRCINQLIEYQLEKKEPTEYTIKYDANDIYNLIEDFPEKIAKEIKWELGYKRDDYMGLEYDIKDIRGSLDAINSNILEIRIRMPE